MAPGRIFVAGGTGLVGTAVLNRLLAEPDGTAVRASLHIAQPIVRDPRIEYISGDLRSLDACRAMVKGCDCAIMAAAYTGGARLVTSFPWVHVKENLSLNLQMLEAIQLEGVRRVVFISSATLYQDSEGHLAEADLDLNQDPAPAYMGFGWAVRFVEKICRMMHDRFGTEVAVVRAANIFGPFAKFDPAASNVVPALIRKATDRMDPFEVWGDPSVTRDLIYSEDFADAVVRLAARDQAGFDVFNVGSGERITIGEIAQRALEAAGHAPLQITYKQDKPTTMRHRALDCSKARKVLGWAPRHTIQDGIRKTTEWWIDNRAWWRR